MTDLATLMLDADTRGLKNAERDLDSMAKTASETASRVGKSMQNLGIGLSASVTVPLAMFGKGAYEAAVQSQQAFAQVESALKSMGNASGRTAEQLQASAKQLETFSNFDDDDILQKVTANMLTFGNVSGVAFDRAQQAAVNLSARLGNDLQSSALLVGKALNDPVNELAQIIADGFPKALRLAAGDGNVVITAPANPAPAFPDGAYYRLPVRVAYLTEG